MSVLNETPEQEAARINAASGDPEGITAEQVSNNRRLNAFLSGAVGRKPDGSPIDENSSKPGLPKGTAIINTDKSESGATVEIEGGEAETPIVDPTQTTSTEGRGVRSIPNPLEQFASYSPLWTMACLTREQFNDPRSYRNSPADLKHIVFSSAGRYDDQRVKTFYGAPEYFINNFMMTTVISPNIATGNSNAISFNFDIYEPYSMGLFLQSLQLAAINAGYANYLSNTPYLLKLDYVGYDDSGKLFEGVTPKYFTIRLKRVTFNVTEGGSVYKVEAFPFNHQGFSNLNNRIPTDTAITGNTVKELLVAGERSLCAALNESENQLVNDKKKTYPDTYEIQFPEEQDQILNFLNVPATDQAKVDPNAPASRSVGARPAASSDFGNNDLGNSDMGFDAASGGNYVFRKEGDVYDDQTGKVKRDQMIIDPKLRTFIFTQEQTITSVISQILLSSKYIVENIRNVKIDESGLITWFRVDVQVQLLEFDKLIGDYQKKIIFRVLPYKTHISIFTNPTTAPPGYDSLEKYIAKKYQYIYTGQNNDILRFDIQINNMFFVGINSRAEKDNATVSNTDINAPVEDKTYEVESNEGSSGDSALAGNTGGRRTGPDSDRTGTVDSGSGDVTEAKKVAEAFNRALLKSNTDIISIDLEVLGDPYWMVDSGFGNYFSPVNPDFLGATQDGTMNYEAGDVYVYLSFRTPSDIDERRGIYNFPDQEKEAAFSGIYRVIRCENEFRDGAFKQKLRCLRMPLQPYDFDSKPQPKDSNENILAINVKDEVVKPTVVYDPF